MAVDTAAKRLSMMQLWGDSSSPGIIIPDGTISDSDRSALLWGYSGITWANVSTVYELIRKYAPIVTSVSFSAEIETTLRKYTPIETTKTIDIDLI